MVDDINSRGIKLDVPGEPLHDPAFINALNAAYDIGGPSVYPAEAPIMDAIQTKRVPFARPNTAPAPYASGDTGAASVATEAYSATKMGPSQGVP